jgi:hypothetical protein
MSTESVISFLQFLLFPADGRHFRLGHFAAESVITDSLDAFEARFTVGTKNKSKYPGHEIVEILAFRQDDLPAIGAAGIFVFHVAGAHLAPGGFLVFMATGTFFIQVAAAGAAIEAAKSYQIFVNSDFSHFVFPFLVRVYLGIYAEWIMRIDSIAPRWGLIAFSLVPGPAAQAILGRASGAQTLVHQISFRHRFAG